MLGAVGESIRVLVIQGSSYFTGLVQVGRKKRHTVIKLSPQLCHLRGCMPSTITKCTISQFRTERLRVAIVSCDLEHYIIERIQQQQNSSGYNMGISNIQQIYRISASQCQCREKRPKPVKRLFVLSRHYPPSLCYIYYAIARALQNDIAPSILLRHLLVRGNSPQLCRAIPELAVTPSSHNLASCRGRLSLYGELPYPEKLATEYLLDPLGLTSFIFIQFGALCIAVWCRMLYYNLQTSINIALIEGR